MLSLLFLAEFIVLLLLSRALTQSMYALFLLIFRFKPIALSLSTVLLFPGTVIHELSHLFVAEILGVRTGRLTLVPEPIQGEEEIRTGSVMVAHTDPFRRYAIGLAPVFVGLLVLTAIAYWLPTFTQSVFQSGAPLASNPNTYYLLGLGYLLFAISNSMFSSPEDLKGFIPFAITLALLIGAAYLAGLRLALTGWGLDIILRILDTLVKSLGVVLAVNALLLLVIHVLIVLIGKIFHRKVVQPS